eukprot:6289840-Amphidinium_carterae.1
MPNLPTHPRDDEMATIRAQRNKAFNSLETEDLPGNPHPFPIPRSQNSFPKYGTQTIVKEEDFLGKYFLGALESGGVGVDPRFLNNSIFSEAIFPHSLDWQEQDE